MAIYLLQTSIVHILTCVEPRAVEGRRDMSERSPLLPSSSATTIKSDSNNLRLSPFASSFQPRATVASILTLQQEDSARIEVSESPTTFLNPAQLRLDQEQQQQHQQNPSPRRSISPSPSSSFSYASLPPTFAEFRRSHIYIAIPISAGVLAALSLTLIFWTREIRWIEIALGAVAFLASEALKEVIFELFSTVEGPWGTGKSTWAATIIYSFLQEGLRLGGIALLVKLLPIDHPSMLLASSFPPKDLPRRPLPPLDTLFFSSLFFSIGWSAFEVGFASREFLRTMSLYSSVLDGPYMASEDDYDDEDDEEESSESGERDVERSGKNRAGEGAHEEENDRIIRHVEEGLPLHQPHIHIISPRTGSAATYKSYRNGTSSPEDTLHQLQREQHQDYPRPREISPYLSESAYGRIMLPLEMEEREFELDERIRKLERDEFELKLGVPLYEVPVAITIVWRIDSILLALVLTLLLSLPFRTTSPSLFPFPLFKTYLACVALHSFYSLLWILKVRANGIAAISYFTLVSLLASFFAVLAAWGALN